MIRITSGSFAGITVKVRIRAILSSTITAKGQTTIPAEIRKKLALKPGDRIRYLEEHGKVRIIAADRCARDLKGLLPKPKKPVRLGGMDKAFVTGRSR